MLIISAKELSANLIRGRTAPRAGGEHELFVWTGPLGSAGQFATIRCIAVIAFSALLAITQVAAQPVKSIIIPLGAADSFANAQGGLTADESYQLCYNKKNFLSVAPTVLLIQEIGYRVDESTVSLDVTIPRLEIWGSTFTKEISKLSPIQHFNYGSNRRLLFSGENIKAVGGRDLGDPRKFQINLKLQHPFLYDPAEGHLLIDVDTEGPYPGTFGVVDGVFRDDDLIFTVRNIGEGVIYPVGDILQIAYVPIPRVTITTIGAEPSHARIMFFATDGLQYALQAKTNFNQREWETLTNFISSSDGFILWEQGIANREKYFRLMLSE